MDPLSQMLNLAPAEKLSRGLEHTPHEIAQQPDTWAGTFRALESKLPEIQQFLTRSGIGAPADQRPIVFLIGAGTSDYIGHSLHHLLRARWQCEVLPVASTSLLTNFSDYILNGQRYLWISFSRSGDSPEGVAVLERAMAEHPNISHLLVSCNERGKMYLDMQGRENCLAITLDDAVNDRSLAMTSSFTNMVLTGQILAHAWSIEEYQPVLDSLVASGRALLPRAASLASELVRENYQQACFVGSGLLAGTAKESALKVLELTAGKVQTMSQATLALRHGPMAALQHHTLFVSLVSSQLQRRKYEIDLLREIGAKELVATRVAVSLDNPESLQADAEKILTPGIDAAVADSYRPVLDVLFAQLLGLFASLHHGLKPDHPSPSGAISRVVQSFGIY